MTEVVQKVTEVVQKDKLTVQKVTEVVQKEKLTVLKEVLGAGI